MGVLEPATERGGLKERFSVGTATWVDGKRKEEKELWVRVQTASCVQRSRRNAAQRGNEDALTC